MRHTSLASRARALGHLAILAELGGRVVEHSDPRPRGGEHRALLPSSTREAQPCSCCTERTSSAPTGATPSAPWARPATASSKPALDYSFHMLASNTKQLLDTLGIQEVVVVGHSMGGMLATRFARLFPDTTTHFVLENPIGLEDYRFFVPWRSTEDLYRDQLGATEEMIYQQPVVHEFPLVRAPVLLVIGQEDRTVVGRGRVSPEVLPKHGQYPELGKRTAKAFPNATLVELPNVGHIPHFEAPEKWHQALLGFLAK